MALDLSALSTEEAVTAIFVGYYDRAPAPNGLDYWVNDIENNGFSLADVARAFALQSESQALYPELGTTGTMDLEANVAFVTAIFQNLFGRDPNNITDNGGADNFWVNELQNGADVGQLILDIISGAQGNDLAIISNKIDVGLAYSDASEAAGVLTRTAGADTILDDVDASAASVLAAKADIADTFPVVTPENPGEEYFLTSGTDAGADFTGTDADDTFNAFIAQNPFAGGVSNTLSSADRLDGGAGNDRLYAEVTGEFVGVVGNVSNIDIQPRIKNIEEIDIEARESNFLTIDGLNGQATIVDAKNITDHVEIGSYYSDGDLKIENLTTLTTGGTARNTSEITVTMDHTDNFNSDGDASDLTVLFDNDYLLSGQTSVGTADFFLLDQDAELRLLRGQAAEGRLDEIDKNGIRFQINGETVEVAFADELLDEDAPNEVNSHDAFIAALQAPLQALIADGTLPAGTQIVRFDFTEVVFDDDGLALNRAGLQDGSFSDLIPSVRVISGDGSAVTPLGFSAPDEITGEFNIFGRFDNDFDQADEPISIDIDLHKVGRGGDGGNLIVGGKQLEGPTQPGIADGIEVFNIDVLGAGSEDPDGAPAKPSSLGTVTSTQGELGIVNIATAAAFVNGSTFASLEIRDGFNAVGSQFENDDLQRVNANSFLGDLYLGTNQDIINADAVTALGGGDVVFNGAYNGFEDNQEYTVVTGDGDDTFDINIDGDAVDAVTEGFSLDMGNGDNTAFLSVTDDLPGGTGSDSAGSSNGLDANGVSPETTDRLMNLDAVSGSGEDYVEVQGMGTWNIDTNGGSDMVYINSGGTNGAGNLWNTTGPSAFAPVVVYRAQLAISVAGFESVVNIDTGSDFILTEQELNAAILEAIDANPEVARLVTAAIGTSDQDLIVRSLIDGVNEVGLQIRQPELLVAGPVTAGTSQVVLAAADVAGMTRDLIATGVAPNSTPVDTAAEIVAFFGDDGNTRFGNGADDYNGTITTFIADADQPAGTTGTIVNNSVINVGTGSNDLVVLSANDDASALGLSQNTIVFDDLNAGKVSIVNWFDNDTTANLLSNGVMNQVNGNHLLDFTAFLTNRSTDSGSAQSTVYEGIEVVAGTTMEANSIHFVDVDTVEAITGGNLNFATLNAASVKAAIEFGPAGVITYGTQVVTDGISTTGLALGTTARTSIIAIENVDTETVGLESTNHGEYKFFQIIYGLTAEGDDSTVTVNEITVADFGDSIDTTPGTLDVSLVGSVANGEADYLV